MATMKIDQLNSPVEQVVEPNNVLDIDTFFDEMYLSDSEIAERKDLAKNIYTILAAILAIIKANEVLKNSHDIAYYKDYVIDSMSSLYKGVFNSNKYQSQIESFANDFVDSTMRHIDTPYFTSDDRAIVNAEQQSNAIYNQEQYQQATASGKTRKTWVTMHDQRVRKNHDAADGQEVDIDKPFEVGDSELMFPCDLSLGANLREICNCRCVVVYSGDEEELTADEEKAITDYLSPSSLEFNELMRNNLPLTSSMEKWKDDLKSALNKMPKYNGTVYRYINVDDVESFTKEYEPDSIKSFDQFISGSKVERLYGDETTHNVEFVFVDSKNGRDISKINQMEQEVLFQYTQKFVTIDSSVENGMALIFMREGD